MIHPSQVAQTSPDITTTVNHITPKAVYSKREAAEFLGVSVDTINRMIASGTLIAYRLKGGRSVRIKHADLMAVLEPIPSVGTMAAGLV